MKRILYLLAILLYCGNAAYGQMVVISPKGTRVRVDTNWTLSGTNLYNKNTGNIGIGTTTPASILDIQQTTNGPSILQLRNLSNGLLATGFLSLGNDARAQQGVIFVNSSVNTGSAGINSLNIQNKTAAPIAFFVNNLERMRIDGTGRIGFGTIAPSNVVEVNSGIANTSGITITQLNGAASQPLGVSTTGVVGFYNPTNKQFVTQTNGGTNLTLPVTYPLAADMAENVAISSKWTTFVNMNKTLVVSGTTSYVEYVLTGGFTFNVTSVPGGVIFNEFAIGLFVDGFLRSVKNFVSYATVPGAADFTVAASGSVTNLSAGSHTFQIGILPRLRNSTSDWYLFSSATAIGGFPEFPNRATTSYRVVDQ